MSNLATEKEFGAYDPSLHIPEIDPGVEGHL